MMKQLVVIIIHPHHQWTRTVTAFVVFLSSKPQTQHCSLWTKNSVITNATACCIIPDVHWLDLIGLHISYLLLLIVFRLHHPSFHCPHMSRCNSYFEQWVAGWTAGVPTRQLFHCRMFPNNKLDLPPFIWQDKTTATVACWDAAGLDCRPALQARPLHTCTSTSLQHDRGKGPNHRKEAAGRSSIGQSICWKKLGSFPLFPDAKD